MAMASCSVEVVGSALQRGVMPTWSVHGASDMSLATLNSQL